MAAPNEPSDTIERILFVNPKVYVYQVPPLTSSTKGHTAASWTVNEPIFTARMRIRETTEEGPSHAQDKVTVTILLEEPSSAELFAAAPYTHPSVVAHCHDSSRFFALRVVGPGEGGKQMKATLGVGFEERSDAFDFGVVLQDAGKVLGLEKQGAGPADGKRREEQAEAKDYSLKEGQTITVNIGGRGSRINNAINAGQGNASMQPGRETESGHTTFLPPPPPPSGARERRKSGSDQHLMESKSTAQELGFDEGEFGEFQ